VPDQPDAVVTTRVNLNIRITWTAPTDNFKAITAYRVIIEDTDASGNYIENVAFCDGSVIAIRTQLYCDVPAITVLRQDPYSLVLEQLVVAKV